MSERRLDCRSRPHWTLTRNELIPSGCGVSLAVLALVLRVQEAKNVEKNGSSACFTVGNLNIEMGVIA